MMVLRFSTWSTQTNKFNLDSWGQFTFLPWHSAPIQSRRWMSQKVQRNNFFRYPFKRHSIAFEFHPLDCKLFYCGYRMRRREIQLTVGIWNLPDIDIKGKSALIPLCITCRNGLSVLENEFLTQSYQIGPKNVLRNASGVGLTISKDLFLRTYSRLTSPHDSEVARTYLSVVAAKVSSFTALLTGTIPNIRSKKDIIYVVTNEKIFACKLHRYAHFMIPDMVRTYQQRSPYIGFSSCFVKRDLLFSMCKMTGRSENATCDSFNRLIALFNKTV